MVGNSKVGMAIGNPRSKHFAGLDASRPSEPFELEEVDLTEPDDITAAPIGASARCNEPDPL
jgi:hypothetical protein